MCFSHPSRLQDNMMPMSPDVFGELKRSVAPVFQCWTGPKEIDAVVSKTSPLVFILFNCSQCQAIRIEQCINLRICPLHFSSIIVLYHTTCLRRLISESFYLKTFRYCEWCPFLRISMSLLVITGCG